MEQKNKINFSKIEEYMEKEIEQNLFSKCLVCGIVVSNINHLNQHK